MVGLFPLLSLTAFHARAQADLITTLLPVGLPAEVGDGNFFVTNIVENIGDAPALSSFYVRFLISGDQFPTEEVIARARQGTTYTYFAYLGDLTAIRTTLAASERRTNVHRLSLFVPEYPVGAYYLHAYVDAGAEQAEANEFNNFATPQPVQVVHGQDLGLTELQTDPVWTNGGYANIRCVLTNRFQAPLYSHLQFYLSTDPIITPDDVWMGEAEIAFAPDLSTVFEERMRVFGQIPSGTYYFGAIAGYFDYLESDLSNNSIVGQPVEWRSDINLKLLSCTGPSSAVGGRVISVSATVTNTGAIGYAEGFRIGLYLSTDPVITTSDLVIVRGGYYHPASPGSVANEVFTFRLPSFVPAGTYYLGAIADFEQHVLEPNEADNALPGTPIEVSVEADVAITAVSAPPIVPVGGIFGCSATITNVGAVTHPDWFYVGFFASTNPVVTTNDLHLGDALVWAHSNQLWNKVERSFSNIYHQNNVPPGNYYIGAILDWRNQLAEVAESNNMMVTGPVQFRIGLDIAALSVSSASVAGLGAPLMVTNTFANAGLDPLPSYTPAPKLYFSTDSNITTEDWRIDQFWQKVGMPVGSTVTTVQSHIIPENIPPGRYYIGLITDSRNELPELDESNNAVAGNIVEVLDPKPVTLNEVRVSGNNVAVSFKTVAGRYYSLERTASLAEPIFWVTVPGANDLLGTGGTMVVPDPAGLAAGPRIYRVRMRP
ncbi:MAG TPA: CARDB domain-containing protein [Methylomirabilota bacterium]|nr:CARDB domain-containing protein [Methylomirabilota bacterium]